MTLPVDAAHASGTAAGALSHPITLPSGISAGDLLVVVFSSLSASVFPFIDVGASGKRWFKNSSTGNFSVAQTIFAKIAEGSDVLTLLTASAMNSSHISYRVTGHGSAVTIATATGSGSADAPNCTQSGSAQDTLWLAAMTGVSHIATAAPSGFGTLLTVGTTNAFTSTAELGVAASSSENPGAFTNASDTWVASTIGIASTAITTKARVTQVPTEVLSQVNPKARMTQIAIESLTQVNPKARITQVVVEVLSSSALVVANRQAVCFVAC